MGQIVFNLRVHPRNMRKLTRTQTTVPLIVLDDDPAVADHARALFAQNVPVAVVSSQYSTVVPFMLGNNGYTVALVADVDDPDQLAEAIVIVERRLGRVGSVVRYAADLPAVTARRSAVSAA
ncbi:hypothetical protein GORHZ_247_00080 [Gordonia rhizosphera NBRC 16068]|uniref:Uncharacterized protein n=2 Tax=Gordonia rhizosphera TaxID=83341 RepID=K6W3Z1_9ACTN|nr:hypothetical protein GORHZ_247_00080 [Gordonia rhizosphera NBRC 16068]